MQEKVIASVDFGSSKISASLAIIRSDDCEILGSNSAQSFGISKGIITDEEKCQKAFLEVMEKTQKTAGNEALEVFAGINLKDIRISEVSRKIKINDEKVTYDDIKKVLKKVWDNTLTSDDEMVADIFINFYKLDEKVSVQSVVNWVGSELEINCSVLVGKSKELNKYIRIIQNGGFKFSGFYINQVASSKIFLREKNSMGTKALVDIGGDTTNISVFNNGQLKSLLFRPIGGTNITKDLSICGEISLMQSEQVKCINSQCFESLYNDKTKGDEVNIGTYKFSKELYYQVVKARIEELLKFVKLDLKNTSFYEGLCSIIIYGDGVTYFENIKGIAQSQLHKRCTVATNKYLGMKKTSNITSLAGIEDVFDKAQLLGDIVTFIKVVNHNNKLSSSKENKISFDLDSKSANTLDSDLDNDMGVDRISSRRILREKKDDKNESLWERVKRMLEDFF